MKDRSKRHSSLEPGEVDHLESSTGGVYALVNKFPKKKSSNKEVSDLLSSTVRAQLPLDATDQIQNWGEGDEQREGDKEREGGGKKDPRRQPGYVQLHFHRENGEMKGKIEPERTPPSASSRVDVGKTKFGYSTVVFEKEKSKDLVEKKRQKLPPQPPPRYEGSAPALSKNASDSQLLYADVNHHKTAKSNHGTSSPDLSQSSSTGYVNVRYNATTNSNAPVIPPRRGVAAIPESPEFPARKIS